ncbi:MAG: shikimate dehydrogenase [Ignavibacteria bacterium]|nr:MAG: shikimate dehydrogenase [Ignavibacteria bacterium]
MISFNKFNHNTRVIGVIGHPIKHSFSPLMHNISLEMNGIEYIYLPFDVPDNQLKDAIRGMVALQFVGLNVTLPHKEKIIQYLNNVSEEANVIGAVNTIVNENGNLSGYNTDVNGIYATLENFKEDISGNVISVFGAGGAARSAIYTAIRFFNPEKINIINRTVEKAESLKDYFSEKMLFENIEIFELIPPDLTDTLQESKLIINATSIGMSPEVDDCPIATAEGFNDNQIVFDIVYNPLQTKFLSLAESKGAKTLNGLKMFVEQGAKSFELWTGQQMNKEKIYKTLANYLST